jgi:ParB-like chromosome segregation protein Spo0J
MIKNRYLKKMEDRLEELNFDVERLKGKAAALSGEARAVYDEQVRMMRARRDEAGRKLAEVRETGATNWGHLKAGVDKAFEELRKSIDRAIETYRKSA